jgi:hypothetical protein
MKIFHNANIYSPQNPRATALAIDHGQILAVGSECDILESFPAAAEKIDLNGRTIWPGLTDAHVHLRHLAESLSFVDCETETLDECLERVRQAAKDLPTDAWIRGHGWNQNIWAEGFGNASQLDQVAAGHPVYLTAKSLHAGWANTRALKLAGITPDSHDPQGGIIQRSTAGKPTGILFEKAMNLVYEIIPQPTPAQLEKMLRQLIPQLWQMGLVSVHDFDGMLCWQALQRLHQSGELKFRVHKNIPFDGMHAFIDASLRTNYGDDWLNIGGVKLFSDGALGPQTAAMLEPFEGTPEKGALLLSEDEIFEIGQDAVRHGLALTIHAIGDLANRVVLQAYRRLRAFETQEQLSHPLHRVEHVQIINPDDLHWFSDLNIVASVQPVHAPSDMWIAESKLGPRAAFAYAYQTLWQKNAFLVFGSDAPVEPINPFQGLHAAVTRTRLNNTPGPEGWQPQEKLSLEQALAGFTHHPAVIIGRGNHLGTIASGYIADFIILDEDPFIIHPSRLGSLSPVATFIEGECVYRCTEL